MLKYSIVGVVKKIVLKIIIHLYYNKSVSENGRMSECKTENTEACDGNS